MANKTSAFRESAKKIGIYQPRSVDEANEMLNELNTRSQGITNYLNSDKESSVQDRIKYQDQITGARRQLDTISKQYGTDLSENQKWYDEANSVMQDRKNAYVQRVMQTQAENNWGQPDNRTTLQKVTDKLLGVDRTKVTGGKTDWGKLAEGAAVKGANQANAGFWSGVGIFNDIGKKITNSKVGNWLFGDLADGANAIATTTINGAIDTINSIFGTNYAGIKNGQSALDFLVSDAQAGKANAEAKYEKNANTSRAAQIIDQFGTSTVAAIPMAIEAAILAPTQAMQAAQVTTSGLSYFSGMQNARGVEAIGMMGREGLNKLFRNPQFWTSYLQAAGDGYESAKEDGMNQDDAAVYALTNGFFNAMVEVGGADEALGGIQNLPMRLRQAAESGNKSAVVNWFKDSVLGEAWEEVQQGAIERGTKSFFGQDVPIFSLDPTDNRAIINPYTAGQEFLGGAVVGGVLGGGQVAANSAVQSVSDSRTFNGDASALIKAAKNSAQEADQASIAQIESAMAARKGRTITMGEARTLQEIASRTGNMHAYVQNILQAENQQRADQQREATQQSRVRRYLERVRAGEVDQTGTADTKGATIQYEGRQAKVDFVRDGDQNRVRLTFDDGTERTVSYQEAADAGLDENVRNLMVALSAIGPNAPAAYSVYESDQEVGRYAAAMDEAINLYAAQGQDVRKAAAAARESNSPAMITYLTDAQLELAQSLGSKIYEQKQTQVKEAGAKLAEIRQAAQQAMSAQDVTATEGLAAVNATLTDARQHLKNVQQAYNDTMEYLDEMAANGQEGTEAYQNALEQANALRDDLDGTQKVIEALEDERKKLQARQPIKRKQGTVSFEGGTINGEKVNGVDRSKLTRQQKNVVAMVEALADAVNVDYVFFDGDAKGNQGAYVQGGTVYINVNAGMAANKALAAATLSHELTHYMQEYAPEEYEQLKQFIISNVLQKGELDRLVQQQLRLEPNLSYDQALDEVVANACQTMLQDSKAIAKLARQNMTLAEKIADYIEDITARLKAAFEDVNYKDNLPLYNAVKAMEDQLDEMQRLWDAGIEAATENYNAQNTVRNAREQAENAQETQNVPENAETMPAAAQRADTQEESNTQTQFQMWDTVEETDRLIAVHNKSVSGLRRMLQRHGVPFPSIAIKKAGTPHEGFGDVSIVFPRSTIDPEVNRQNRLYSNDAWTPTEPIEEYDVGDMYRYHKKFRKMIGEDVFSGLKGSSYLEESDVSRKLQYNRGDIFAAVKDISAVKYAYLKSIGQEPQISGKAGDLFTGGNFSNEEVLAVFDAFGTGGMEAMEENDDATRQKIRDALNEWFAEKYDGTKLEKKARESKPYDNRGVWPDDFKRAWENYKQNNYSVKVVPDYDALDRSLRNNSEVLNDPRYKEWIEEQFSDLIKDKGIPNGKDYYTPSGNVRSFKARHVPATLENIVAQMQKEQERGVGVMGVNLRGAATKAYRNVEEMRADSGRLLGTHVSDDVYDSYMKGFQDRLYELTQRAANGSERWEVMDSAQEILLETLRDSTSKQNMDTRLRREAQWINYSKELANDLWALRNDVQNMPAPYFEAKPRRIVYPEEALAYILPDNADQDVVDQLNQIGYNVLTYKAGDEADRLEKLNSVEKAKFQAWDEQMAPEIRQRIEDADALEARVRDYFQSVPEDSNYYLSDDEISEMMELDRYAVDGDIRGAERIVEDLSELSKNLYGDEKTQAYELMDALIQHLSVMQQDNWTEMRIAQNKTFAEWYGKKHPSLYYPGYEMGKLNVDKEVNYLRELIDSGTLTAEDEAEAQRLYDAMRSSPYSTWYQKWDNTGDDTSSEDAGRRMAYAMIQAENNALKDAVNALNELTNKQNTTIARLEKALKLTKTPEVRQGDANRLARQLVKDHSSTADASRVAAELKAMGDYILQNKKIDADTVKQRARAIAAELVENAEVVDDLGGELATYRGIADDIRGKKLTIDEDFIGELGTADGYDAFRKANFGNFTLAKRGTGESAGRDGYTTVGGFYQTLQQAWGEAYFPNVANEGEQIQVIADMFQRAKGITVNPNEDYMGEATEELANRIAFDVMDGIMRPTPPTQADRQKARLDEARQETMTAEREAERAGERAAATIYDLTTALDSAQSRQKTLMESIRELERQGELSEKEAQRMAETIYDLSIALDNAESRYKTLRASARERYSQLREEGRARATEAAMREREKANERISALKNYYHDLADRARERRNEAAGSTKYRKKIQQQVKKLSDWLMKNSDKEHVPEAIKAPLLEFLTAIDFTSKRALRGGEQTQNDVKFGARLQKLQQMLQNQQRYIDGDGNVQQDLGGYIDIGPDMQQVLQDMAQRVTEAMETGETYTINTMSAAELKDLSNLIATLTAGIRNMNSFMANARYESVREAAAQDIETMQKLGKARDSDSSMIAKFLKWKDATPYYAMKRFGQGGRSIFDGLTRGWEKLAQHAQQIISFTEKAYTDKEVNAWKKEMHSFTLEDGSEIRMTTAQIMELAMLLKRPQAVQHITKGGIRIGNIETTANGQKRTITDTTHYHLTADDIVNVLDTLTDRQREVANTLQKYMAEQGAKWGNEITMRRFGYEFYTEGENYYPIRTDDNTRPMADTDAQQNSMFRLLNLSSSKSLNPKASNALVVNDIFDTFADHMADQAKLNALGLPILDAIKWFNYRERIDLGDGAYNTVTMQAAMEQAYGEQAKRYFRTLMKDINGVTESGDRGTDLASRMMSNYKIASVGANLRVAMLQPTAYVRAQTVISPRNLIRAFAYKNGIKEAMEHSGTAIWKSLGYYDTNISRSMRQQIQHNETIRDKLVEKSMKMAEHGDQVTWGRLWIACKLQAQDMNPGITGDDLMQKTADLFREVVYSSQVMDSTLTRSELMRSHSFWDKNLTAFMAEPTLSYNIMMDAYITYENDVRANGRQGAWQRNSETLRRAFTVYMSSAVVSAIAESIADAIRDDDDDETAIDKFLQAFLGEDSILDGNMFQDVILTGKIPYAKNIWSLLQGYENSDMIFGGISNLIKVFEIWRETVQLATGDLEKPTKVTYYGNMTEWGKIYKTLQSISQISGFPISGGMRDVFAIWNATVGNIVPYWKVKTYDKNRLSQSQKNAYNENLKGSGITEGQYQQMRTEMDADGNGSLKQDEVGMYLNEQVKARKMTEEQASAVWATAGPSWKKTYSEWNGKPASTEEPAAAATTQTVRPAPTPESVKITTYDQFKSAAHIYSDKRETAYNLWESSVQPLGIDLDRYTQYINVSDVNDNGSVTQEEMGATLTEAINRGELNGDQAEAIWHTLWNGGRSKTYASWAAKNATRGGMPSQEELLELNDNPDRYDVGDTTVTAAEILAETLDRGQQITRVGETYQLIPGEYPSRKLYGEWLPVLNELGIDPGDVWENGQNVTLSQMSQYYTPEEYRERIEYMRQNRWWIDLGFEEEPAYAANELYLGWQENPDYPGQTFEEYLNTPESQSWLQQLAQMQSEAAGGEWDRFTGGTARTYRGTGQKARRSGEALYVSRAMRDSKRGRR